MSRRRFYTLISLAVCVVLCCVAAAALIPATTASAYNADPSSGVLSDIYTENANGGEFNQTNLQALVQKLGASSVEGLKSGLTASGKSITNANTSNEIVVYFGGIRWIAAYLSLADSTNSGASAPNGSNKPNSGDVILTLWQAYGDETAKYHSYYQNSDGNYPTNMYGSSEIRATTLNNGGKYATAYNASSMTGTATQSNTNRYAKFTMATYIGSKDTNTSGAAWNSNIRSYLVAPKFIQWQQSQDATTVGLSYATNNEGLTNGGGGSAGSYVTKNKDGYANWGDDLIWLPSLTETGRSDTYTGIWKTTTAQRQNGTTVQTNGRSWLRSANNGNYSTAYDLISDGTSNNNYVTNEYLVRPALHLNLTSAAGAAHSHEYEWSTVGTQHQGKCKTCESTVTHEPSWSYADNAGDLQHKRTCSYNGTEGACTINDTENHSWTATGWTWSPSDTSSRPSTTPTATASLRCTTCSGTRASAAATVQAGATSNATCTTTGSITYTATLSSSYTSGSITNNNVYAIAAAGHTFRAVPATVGNDCQTPGLVAHYECTNGAHDESKDGGKYFLGDGDQYKMAKGAPQSSFLYGQVGDHNFTDTPAKAADCETDASYAYRYCSTCSLYYAEGTLPGAGTTLGQNSNDSFVASGTALGHDWTNTVTVQWTWTGYTQASVTITCGRNCHYVGGSHTESVVPVLSENTAATCTADRTVDYTATVTYPATNGKDHVDKKLNVVDEGTALGHDWTLDTAVGASGWIWSSEIYNGSDPTAQVALECLVCNNAKVTVAADVNETASTEANCTDKPTKTFTAKLDKYAKGNGSEKELNLSVEKVYEYGEANGHDLKVEWVWSRNANAVVNSDTEITVTATVTCNNCSDFVQNGVAAQLNTQVEDTDNCDQQRTITASASLTVNNGKTDVNFNDERTFYLAAGQHAYVATFTWSDWDKVGTPEVSVELVCSVCGDRQTPSVTVTKGDEVAPKCEVDGYVEFTAKAEYGDASYEETKQFVVEKTGHNFAEGWTTDNDYHWHACQNSDCDAKDAYTKHDWTQEWSWGDSEADLNSLTLHIVCQVCEDEHTFNNGDLNPAQKGERVEPTCNDGSVTYAASVVFGESTFSDEHTYAIPAVNEHVLSKTDKVEPTCDSKGREAYWTCSECGNHFRDEDGAELVADLSELDIAQLEHVVSEWVPSIEGHKGSCDLCGKEFFEEHDFVEGECSVCGYTTEQLLEDTKDEAEEEIDDETDDAEDEIDQKLENGEITPEEAERLKKKLKDLQDKAKEDLEKAQSPEEVERIKQKYKDDVASLLDTDSVRNISWIVVIIIILVVLIAIISLLVAVSKRKANKQKGVK